MSYSLLPTPFSYPTAVILTHSIEYIWTFFLSSFLSATFDRIAEINFNLDADDNSVSVLHVFVSSSVT